MGNSAYTCLTALQTYISITDAVKSIFVSTIVINILVSDRRI